MPEQPAVSLSSLFQTPFAAYAYSVATLGAGKLGPSFQSDKGPIYVARDLSPVVMKKLKIPTHHVRHSRFAIVFQRYTDKGLLFEAESFERQEQMQLRLQEIGAR